MTPDTALACACRPSANHNGRRVEGGPDMLILHYTGMGTGEAALRWLCDPSSEVSCHYLVHEDGRIVQMVPETERAWHAGAGSWRGRADVNSRSIGIEIVNAGHDGGLPDYPDVQIEAVIALGLDIVARHAIAPDLVLAHSDIAPSRKQDPGERFPWARLAAAGLGHHCEPVAARSGRYLSRGDRGEPVEAYQGLLAAYGYEGPVDGMFDEPTRLATIAFQRHFRPERVDGVADASTIATLHRLLVTLPSSPLAPGA
ncbi:N-acetylmuramoyl-L-alanine amidase [Aurantimonas sp. Leaf443]|uniref:peptidoglycan recognition protein family protein n=1 Tax=Aurantimonas sp. Leaf443 TaxID=1736378 RepID=UPI0006F4AF31|nr:N-acetylmuramoyl-L-alanine amidase [Aurantimonas sp. Leaf443]KQT88334.1 N-acetylmuramoyl-L-alanine amidase [Aurantimonas sp. Leaf443]